MVKIKVENVENEMIKDENSSEEEEIPEPIQEEVPKTNPKQKMMSCPNCNKEMLQKTFRYYHSLKCKPQEEAQIPQKPAISKPDRIEVTFNAGRRAVKSEKFKQLLLNAF